MWGCVWVVSLPYFRHFLPKMVQSDKSEHIYQNAHIPYRKYSIKPPGSLFVKMNFWGLFSKFELLLSSTVSALAIPQYVLIDKHYIYFNFVYF